MEATLTIIGGISGSVLDLMTTHGCFESDKTLDKGGAEPQNDVCLGDTDDSSSGDRCFICFEHNVDCSSWQPSCASGCDIPHLVCRPCALKFVEHKIRDGGVTGSNIKCPAAGCNAMWNRADLASLDVPKEKRPHLVEIVHPWWSSLSAAALKSRYPLSGR